MTRKLASIQKVAEIRPIPEADKICAYRVNDWWIVDSVGKYQVGELVCYLEIDSWVPHALAPFLSKGKEPRVYHGVPGEKLRTIRLKKQVSQGLLLPLSPACDHIDSELFEGLDITFPLNIQKWEAELPAQLVGQALGTFPSWIRKTDQERCQNLGSVIFGYETTITPIDLVPEHVTPEALASGRLQIVDGVVYSVRSATASPDDLYEVSLKLDGSSSTTFVRRGDAEEPDTGVCSRNVQLKINEENKDNLFVKTSTDTNLFGALTKFYNDTGRSIAVQSELMGPGIQGNREGFSDHKLFVFDIFDIDKQDYMDPIERAEVFDILKQTAPLLNHVPVPHKAVTLESLGIHNVADILAFVEGPSINHPVCEGKVFKRLSGNRFSWKGISNKFLEKNDR